MVTIKIPNRFKKDLYEVTAWNQNELICGIDEVGRGCLAGPVVVAAVILYPSKKSPLLKDSKLMDAQELLKGYAWIKKNSWHATALIDHRTIDEVNIYQATLKAMKRAFMQLMAHCPQRPRTIVIDAMPLQLVHTAFQEIDVHYFNFGEKRSSSIAAASIFAKVTRDQLMHRLNSFVPGYHLDRHKGYSTQLHKQSLKECGHSIIHRISYIDHLSWEEPVTTKSIFEAGDQHEKDLL